MSIYCIFFHFCLSPLYLPHPAVPTLVSMSMSPFSFVLDPSTPKSPIAVILRKSEYLDLQYFLSHKIDSVS